jgi:hypothetical protein
MSLFIRLNQSSIYNSQRCLYMQISAHNLSPTSSHASFELSCQSRIKRNAFHTPCAHMACWHVNRVHRVYSLENLAKRMPPVSAYRGVSGMPEEENSNSGNSSSNPAQQSASDDTSPLERALIKACTVFTQLFPLWCILAAVSGFYHPPLYLWFDTQCISNGLIFIMVRH